MFRFIAWVIELVNWVRIFLSPVVISFFVSIVVYGFIPNLLGMILGGMLILAGFVIGIIWATKICKTKGTTFFMSRIIASPDLDKIKKTKP